jgi:hypothetical protein
MNRQSGTDLTACRALEDYGVIGDCYSLALVAADGTIDWWCSDRFDAAPVFCGQLCARLDRQLT